MSKSVLSIGNFDMLRALYDFQATYAKSLNFHQNDYFILYQTNLKHKNWWQVINKNGEVGFIPSNYIESVSVTDAFYLKFLDGCVNYLENNEIDPEFLISNQMDLIDRIKDLKRQAQLQNQFTNNTTNSDIATTTTVKEYDEVTGSRENPLNAKDSRDTIEEPIKPIHKVDISHDSIKKSFESIQQDYVEQNMEDNKAHRGSITNFDASSNPVITHQSVYDLVEAVRVSTHLSHEMSRVAVTTVIQGLHELLPAGVFPYLSTILSHVDKSLEATHVQIDDTYDASRLKSIFNDLTIRKQDSQQRSWSLHEDESILSENLKDLISILSNADPNICKHVVSAEQYAIIFTLIEFYQMETRWSLRQLLLHAFGVLCNLDKTIVNIMLNSVLPGELARDMQANTENILRLNYSSLLLTMVFSMGEPMPVIHLDLLGTSFLNFLLDMIEEPPVMDEEDQIPELFVNLILSYNLQFSIPTENVVLDAFEQRRVAKIFTEKILLLLNREEDPVRVFDHEPAPPHSVIKLFNDLFSRKSTASLFYTNDAKVLIDIIVRNISDLSAGDKRRKQYLELCRRVMRNTNYGEHLHRIRDITKCFTRIRSEEHDQSIYDQTLVNEIIEEFYSNLKFDET